MEILTVVFCVIGAVGCVVFGVAFGVVLYITKAK